MNTLRALQSTVSVTGLFGDLLFGGICHEPRNNAWCTWRTKGVIYWVSKESFLQLQLLIGQAVGRLQCLSEWLIDCSLTGFLFENLLRIEELCVQLRWGSNKNWDELGPPFPFRCTLSQFTKLLAFTVSSLNENFSSPGQGGVAGSKYYKGILWALVRIVMPWWNKTWGLVRETPKHADLHFLN